LVRRRLSRQQGPSAYGYVIEAPGGEMLAEAAESIGVGTATVAEYRGLLAGFARAGELWA